MPEDIKGKKQKKPRMFSTFLYIIIGIILFIVILVLASIVLKNTSYSDAATEKKVADSLKEIYIPAGMDLPKTSVRGSAVYNGVRFSIDNRGPEYGGGYSISTDVDECPVIDESFLSGSGWKTYEDVPVYENEPKIVQYEKAYTKNHGGQGYHLLNYTCNKVASASSKTWRFSIQIRFYD